MAEPFGDSDTAKTWLHFDFRRDLQYGILLSQAKRKHQSVNGKTATPRSSAPSKTKDTPVREVVPKPVSEFAIVVLQFLYTELCVPVGVVPHGAIYGGMSETGQGDRPNDVFLFLLVSFVFSSFRRGVKNALSLCRNVTHTPFGCG